MSTEGPSVERQERSACLTIGRFDRAMRQWLRASFGRYFLSSKSRSWPTESPSSRGHGLRDPHCAPVWPVVLGGRFRGSAARCLRRWPGVSRLTVSRRSQARERRCSAAHGRMSRRPVYAVHKFGQRCSKRIGPYGRSRCGYCGASKLVLVSGPRYCLAGPFSSMST